MIIFFGEGRLGNQLFQYAFIKNFLRKNELLVTCNFKELLELLDSSDCILNFKNKFLKFLLFRIAVPILKLLSFLRIISSCKSERTELNGNNCENGKYDCRKGLLEILFIYPGYYQSVTYFDPNKIGDMRIKKEYIDKAKHFLARVPKEKKKIFIHIRGGDYDSHIVFRKKGIRLPLVYYTNGIEILEQQSKNNYYIFLSLQSDREFIHENFRYITNKTLSEESMYVDFAIITLCDSGILSNSSFAWWAAYMMNKKGDIIFPEYWVGFKSKIEYPIGISPSFGQSMKF